MNGGLDQTAVTLTRLKRLGGLCPVGPMRLIRVPTDLENLEKSGNFTNLEKSGKSQGVLPKVREHFEVGLSSKANHPRLYLNGRMPGKQDQ